MRISPYSRIFSYISRFTCIGAVLALALAACSPSTSSEGDHFAQQENQLSVNLIENGDFSAGANQWTLGQWGGSSSGSSTAGHYQITVNSAGSAWWNVQFMQRGLPLQQGKSYVISFDAYKGPQNPGEQALIVNVGEDGGDYTSYSNGYVQPTVLTQSPTTYSFTFEMDEPDDPTARIEFNCGLATGTFHLDNISLREVETEPPSDPPSDPGPAYQPHSPFLLHPELAIPFVEKIVAFRSKARDDINGGFYTFVDRQGNPTAENTKSLCGQSRLGYAFTRAFALTGNETYLSQAHHALKFLYDHGYNNGWYFATDIQGNYISHWGHNDWWSFQQHYALVGISAMVEVTGGELNFGDGSQTDKFWLETGITSNYNRLWDNRAGQTGYFDHASRNWSNKWGKGFTATVDAITTHGLLMALMTEDPKHDTRLFELADNIVKHMVGNMNVSGIGFPEVFNADWNVDTSVTVADIGHHYKTAWCLQRAYLLDPSRTEYKAAADAIMWDLWNNGAYDQQYGGPYSRFNWQTGAITDTNKTNWMLEQAVTSGLISYYSASSQADKDMFLEVADGSIDFFMEHQLDPIYSETYAEVSRTGSSLVIADKGGLFNSGYHSVETGYYLYLYGNLFYHKTPVSLYYKFPASSQSREIRLTPLAIQDELLKIHAVELDGSPFTSFDANSRTLTLASGVGGKFKVTFGLGSRCGDGIKDAGEACDDGSSNSADGCSASCQVESVCGDGVVDVGEACDDGNTDNHDRCVSGCRSASCGDGFVETGSEQCDDGNPSNLDACPSSCFTARCGDGFVWAGTEQCDDSNADQSDSCLNNCVAASCGDGLVRTGVESCDDGNQSNVDGCTVSCLVARCGDGFVRNGVETCDDGNFTAGDGCDATCHSESTCQDGITNGGEEGVDCGGSCEPCACESTHYAPSALTYSTGGNTSDGYNIWSNGSGRVSHDFEAGSKVIVVYARGEVAGGSGPRMVVSVGNKLIGELIVSNQTMQPYEFLYTSFGGSEIISVEFTNDYYQSPADRNLIIGGLDVLCAGDATPACGDGLVDLGEGCDDGNTSNTDLCLSSCAVARCGDGFVQAGVEECDDGNLDSNDGCLSTCKLVLGDEAFIESGGLVVMEAEHYDFRAADKTTSDVWNALSVASASAGMCMQVGPDSSSQIHTSQTDAQSNAARLDYEVKFTSTGSWRIWVRGASNSTLGYASDSCHAGMDGVAQALHLDFPENASYAWVAATITVSSPGRHTVQLFMREDGFIVDKIILAKATNYTPTGTSQPESARGL